jgi:virulence-associated protein VapD
VYFAADEKVDPVRCVLAVQDLTRTYPWFAGAVSDIRMLRIEENNDLMPAIEDIVAAAGPKAQ